jgi:hypothetical protein
MCFWLWSVAHQQMTNEEVIPPGFTGKGKASALQAIESGFCWVRCDAESRKLSGSLED